MKTFSLLFFIFTLNTALAVNPGEKAPAFTLMDHNGKEVSLESFKGNKIVVLEWYNHGCPYVKKHYETNNMQTTQKTFATNEDVVWISIVSSAKGKQGYLKDAAEAKAQMEKSGSFADHLVLDHDGSVGQAYSAKTTPHMFVIDGKGIVQYAGAMDSIASANKDDIKSAKNYTLSAISKVLLQQKPSPQKTKPYGCSVKY